MLVVEEAVSVLVTLMALVVLVAVVLVLLEIHLLLSLDLQTLEVAAAVLLTVMYLQNKMVLMVDLESSYLDITLQIYRRLLWLITQK